MKKLVMTSVAVCVIAISTFSALGAEYEVRMLNKATDGQVWQFEPAFLKIQPGDKVTFVPSDKGHNSEAVPGAIPPSAESWKGKPNKPVTVTYTQEGVYLYKCLPHIALGMVGIIQVGDSTANLDSLRNAQIPAKGKARLDELLALIGS